MLFRGNIKRRLTDERINADSRVLFKGKQNQPVCRSETEFVFRGADLNVKFVSVVNNNSVVASSNL